MVKRPSQNLFLEPRGCWEWGNDGKDSEPALQFWLHPYVGLRRSLVWAPDPWGFQATARLFLGLSALYARASVGSSRGTPEILDLLWPLLERDRSARKRFQSMKIAVMSPNQTRMSGLEGAQKPFVLRFPAVNLNFYCLEPCSRCCA